jgi:hypothetical protein
MLIIDPTPPARNYPTLVTVPGGKTLAFGGSQQRDVWEFNWSSLSWKLVINSPLFAR